MWKSMFQQSTIQLSRNSGDGSGLTTAPDLSMPKLARFLLLITFDIPALVSTCFLLFHLLKDRQLRLALQNHVVILSLFGALITQLIDIPAYIIYSILGYVWPPNPRFCQLWWFINVGIFLMTSILIAYGSIERHILVFNNHFLASKRRRILFHYLPLTGILLYGFTFYTIVIVFPGCEQIFDYTQPWCSYPCYMDQKYISIYDLSVNSIVSIVITMVFSTALVIRVIYEKKRRRRTVSWRRHRRMILQLLSIVMLYLVFNIPVSTLIVAHLCGLPSDVGVEVQIYSYFLCYFIPLLLPYVCLASSPEIRDKLLVFYRKVRPQVQPTQNDLILRTQYN